MNILRVANASGHTSAPLNSFTLARSRFYKDEKTTFLSFYKNDSRAVDLFFENYKSDNSVKRENLSFEEAGGSIKKFWHKAINWITRSQNIPNSIIHLHQPRSGFLVALAAKVKKANLPVIYTVHNNFSNFSFKHKLTLFLNFMLVDRIVFVSKDAYKSFSYIGRLFSKKSIVIQNGVDIERIEKSITEGGTFSTKSSDSVKYISTGRFTKQKNQKFLIDVFEKHEGNWHLDIYGTGQYKDELTKLLSDKGLTNKVNIKDTIPRDEIIKAYAKADIYVSTALWEGLPVAVMEAMASGLPCIVSNIPSHIELGENLPGLKITNFNLMEWSENLKFWNNVSLEERKNLGEQNKKLIQEKFTMLVMQKNYRNLYEKLVKEKLDIKL